MDKNNLELFKQALTEAVSNKFDNTAASCTEEIVCSERHKLAMRAIVYGKCDTKRTWSPRMKRIIAILVAAALLLTSCGIIFRNEIREVFEEFFVRLTYSDEETTGNKLEDVYKLEYLPNGYILKAEKIEPLRVNYEFVNENNDQMYFEQRVLDGSYFFTDIESGYSKIADIEEYEVYCRYNNHNYIYIWNNDKYSFSIMSNQKISNEDIVLIIDGITIRQLF